jgi:transcriptional regulator with XRE-family HTH domain
LREVGELVGATPQHVHDWESGLRGIAKEKAKTLANFFKLPVEYII